MLKEDIKAFAKIKYYGSPSKHLIFESEDPAIEALFHHNFEYAIGIFYQKDYAIYSDDVAKVKYDKKDSKIYGIVKEQFKTSSAYYGYLEVFLFNDAGQRPQVSHQCITAGRTRDISELLCCRGTASVSDVVISGNGKAMPGEVFGKGGIPFYIFAHSVTYLKHGARRSFRCPKAVDYSAAPVR